MAPTSTIDPEETGERLRLPMVAVSGDEMRCIGFNRRLTVLDMEVDESRVTGVTTAGPRSFEFDGVKLDATQPTKQEDE